MNQSIHGTMTTVGEIHTTSVSSCGNNRGTAVTANAVTVAIQQTNMFSRWKTASPSCSSSN